MTEYSLLNAKDRTEHWVKLMRSNPTIDLDLVFNDTTLNFSRLLCTAIHYHKFDFIHAVISAIPIPVTDGDIIKNVC